MDVAEVLTDREIKDLFGDFRYKDRKNGKIAIERDWIGRNIQILTLPWLGKIRCHRFIKAQLADIFDHIHKRGLSQSLDAYDTVRRGGCFFPRHVDWNVSLPLSRHSWGVAIDINPSTNKLGTKGSMDSEVIDIFEENGFAWGGRWRTPDPMHFEFVRFV